jgi:tRNA(Leu) C34 or U34 (ribose-2'-O)-methylase TrmL
MFGVALIDPKNAWNVGNALRSTVAFGGGLFIVQGTRFSNSGDWTKTDTENARDRIPVYHTNDAMQCLPSNVTFKVAVEMVPNATSIVDYGHAPNSIYFFGPEDGRLTDDIISKCDATIYIPTAYSLNLAACVACIGHDRLIKEAQEPKQFCPNCKKSHIKWLENTQDWHCNACGHEWNFGKTAYR